MISLCFSWLKKNSTIQFLKINTNLQPSPSNLKPSYKTLTPSLLSLSLFLRNSRCSKALFNLTLPSELKWPRTPLQVLRIWILIMIFWIILDWIFTFHQNLISLLFIILFWDFIFWSFWAGFSVKDCFFVSGYLLFYLIFLYGIGYAVFFLFLLFGASVCLFLELFLWDIFNVKFQFFTYL